MAEIADIYTVIPSAWCHNQAGLNIHHYIVTAKAGTGSTFAGTALGFEAALRNVYKALIAGEAIWAGLRVQRVWPTLSVATFSKFYQGAGSATGGVLPLQTCGLLTKLTALAGKKNRGRAYIPFPGGSDNETGNNDSQPAAGYLANLTALGTALLGPIVITDGGGNGNTWTPVIYNGLGVKIAITSYRNSPYWATQRRRSDFGRTNPIPN